VLIDWKKVKANEEERALCRRGGSLLLSAFKYKSERKREWFTHLAGHQVDEKVSGYAG